MEASPQPSAMSHTELSTESVHGDSDNNKPKRTIRIWNSFNKELATNGSSRSNERQQSLPHKTGKKGKLFWGTERVSLQLQGAQGEDKPGHWNEAPGFQAGLQLVTM